jgi:hypothetical protein
MQFSAELTSTAIEIYETLTYESFIKQVGLTSQFAQFIRPQQQMLFDTNTKLITKIEIRVYKYV